MTDQTSTPNDQSKWMEHQWPDNICSGFIRYAPSEYGGYVFRDASHGIPVLGHVRAEYHGSYPDQAAQIARRLTACWNALVGKSIDEIESIARANAADRPALSSKEHS
jgi:hypothetical protein